MAKLGINTGSVPNDGTGDTLLAAALKINQNFDEIYNIFGDGSELTGVGYAETASYASVSGIATYAEIAGYASTAGISTYATISGYSTSSGISTYSSISGIATYATNAGVSTYSTISEYSTLSGISTYAIIAGYSTSSGISTLSEGLTGSPNLIVGIVTATSYFGDGSGLTGVTASGTGIVIKDDGATVGTAGTIDFGSNLSVSPISAGVVTVTGAAGGSEQSYWSSTTVGIHTLSNVGVGTTNPRTPLQIENVYGIDTGSGTFSQTPGVAYAATSWTISSTNFKTAEYTLWFQHTSGIQSQKILIMNDGTNAYYEEYGIMYSNSSLVSVGATVESGSVNLLWTPESGVTGVVTFRFTRETML